MQNTWEFYPEITQASRRRCALNQCRVLSAWRPAHRLLPHVPYEHPPTSRTLLSPAPAPRLDVSIPPRPKTHMRPALSRVNLKVLRGARATQKQTTSIKSPITRDGRKLRRSSRAPHYERMYFVQRLTDVGPPPFPHRASVNCQCECEIVEP